MLKNLIIVLVVGVVAYLAYDNGRTITESHVRDYYQAQLEAFRELDEERICTKVADDFSLEVLDRSAGAGKTRLDGYAACDQARKMVKLARVMSDQSAGLMTINIAYDIGSIKISPDGREAVVQSVSTAKLGEMLMARTRSTEKFSRSLWRVQSHGGESQVWSYSGE